NINLFNQERSDNIHSFISKATSFLHFFIAAKPPTLHSSLCGNAAKTCNTFSSFQYNGNVKNERRKTTMCGFGNNCSWIIILIIIFCCCGNNGFFGGECNNNNNCGCC
ncbi:MAG: hypothetical protein ACI4RP_01580, partial [Acutalibacteraceae bacterium]